MDTLTSEQREMLAEIEDGRFSTDIFETDTFRELEEKGLVHLDVFVTRKGREALWTEPELPAIAENHLPAVVMPGWWSDFTDSYMGLSFVPMLDDEMLEHLEEFATWTAK